MLRSLLFSMALFCAHATASAQCEADTTVYLTDFLFTPSELTVSVGETIAFVNAEGLHNVDGTADSNPAPFFLPEVEGSIDGVCMGTVTFDVPGVYTFSSSIGVQPQLGMTGTIVVDAETLTDRLYEFWGGGALESLEAFQSSYALTSYFSSTYYGGTNNPGWTGEIDLDGAETYTLFVPSDVAVDELMALMNLSQFDMLAFYDMPMALKYHIVPGVHMAADLVNGLALPTMQGQSLTITTGDGGIMVDDANLLVSDITAFNGVIHLVDQILAPQGYPSATTWDVIQQSPDHTVFEQALLNEGLDEALRGQPILNDNEPAEGPFTVFAPTDDAFFAFAEENGFADVDELLSSQFIDDIVYGHLVEAVYESGSLSNGLSLSSYDNGTIAIATDGAGISANTAPIVQADLFAYNGVVHALGEVMPFAFPEPTGTCGAWTIHMISDPLGGTGWEGATVNVFADGVLLASETKTTDALESFSFPVDEGSRMDIIYVPDGSPAYHGFEVVDENGQIIYSSNGSASWSGSIPPVSVYGLHPCGAAPGCGLAEITFSDASGDGWFGGSMAVYSQAGLEATISFNPDFDGDGYADYQSFAERKVRVAVDEGEVDFFVNPGVYFPESCGYVVRNPDGELVVDQDLPAQVPENAEGVLICESSNGVGEMPEGLLGVQLYPNPAVGRVALLGFAPGLPWEAELLSTTGQIRQSFQGVGPQELHLHHGAPGLFLLRLSASTGEAKTFRLVLE